MKARRRGKAGRTWHVAETYVKVEGRWCYVYRAIDSDGALDELRAFLRPRTRFNEAVSLAEQRRPFQDRWGEACALLQAA